MRLPFHRSRERHFPGRAARRRRREMSGWERGLKPSHPQLPVQGERGWLSNLLIAKPANHCRITQYLDERGPSEIRVPTATQSPHPGPVPFAMV